MNQMKWNLLAVGGCKQRRICEVTPPPQERVHGVHDVHDDQTPSSSTNTSSSTSSSSLSSSLTTSSVAQLRPDRERSPIKRCSSCNYNQIDSLINASFNHSTFQQLSIDDQSTLTNYRLD